MDFPTHITRGNIISVADILLDGLINVMKESKVELCRNGPEDLDTKIVYIQATRPTVNIITAIPMVFIDGKFVPAQEDPQEALSATLAIAQEKLGPPLLVGHCAEGYAKTFGAMESADSLQRGDLTRLFNQGDPTVKEGLIVSLMHLTPSGQVRFICATSLYGYAEGSPVFDEVEKTDDLTNDVSEKSRGGMYEIMRQCFAKEAN